MSFFGKIFGNVAKDNSTPIKKGTIGVKTPRKMKVGNTIIGHIIVTGGEERTNLNTIMVNLFYSTNDDTKYIIAQTSVKYNADVQPHATTNTEFELTVPFEAPTTCDKNTWFELEYNCNNITSSPEKFFVDIDFAKGADIVNRQLQSLGFHKEKHTSEPVDEKFPQYYKYVPQKGPFRGKVNAVQVIYTIENDLLNLDVEIEATTDSMSTLRKTFTQEELKKRDIIYKGLAELIGAHC